MADILCGGWFLLLMVACCFSIVFSEEFGKTKFVLWLIVGSPLILPTLILLSPFLLMRWVLTLLQVI